jgi:hypothetical protein
VAGCRLLGGIRAKSNKSAAGAPPIAATSIRSPVSLLGYAVGLLSRLPQRSQPVHVFDDSRVTLFFELQRVTLFLFRVSVRVRKVFLRRRGDHY